ncbi:MAG TPA: MltA domain-containing protein [Azospirillaceae bacterium]|nr:MltA domain-containing protein [Azospirillaceae bacterium]
MPFLRALATVAVAAAVMGGCAPQVPPAVTPAPPPDRLVLAPASFDDLPGWREDAVGQAVDALRRSCARLTAQPADRPVGTDGIGGRVTDWQQPCAALAGVRPGDEAAGRQVLETWFRPWVAANNDQPDGLFTGYYEPELRGSRILDGRHTVPLYRRPADLVEVDLGQFREALRGERIAGRVVDGRLRPYDDRTRIDQGALAGRGLELAWVSDPVDAFFLQIQGSGRIVMPDGSVVRVGYDGQNGHPYVAVGRELVQRGVFRPEEVSMQAIRAWMEANPAEAAGLMRTNPSYVFFREIQGEGPVGSQGVALSPGRSLAVDPRFVPLGAPVWLDVEDPMDPATRIRRLTVAQDTGGAIRGPVRGDLFWGHGPDAEARAGRMRSQGRYWLLLPVSVTPPTA